jgi:hypothetical protein
MLLSLRKSDFIGSFLALDSQTKVSNADNKYLGVTVLSVPSLCNGSNNFPSTNMASSLATQPPSTTTFLLSFPTPHVLLVTINREKARNSIPLGGHLEGDAIFTWFDHEPSLRVAVITGAGDKAFCAGQDLIEQHSRSDHSTPRSLPSNGFAGLSRRVGKKPVIVAVNGFALGGGFEICLNS